MRVVFWGTPAFAVPALRALAEEGHEIVGVVTQPDRPAGRGRRLQAPPVKAVAQAEGWPVLQPARARDPAVREQLVAWAPDVSVVVAYGQILPSSLLEVPRFGSVAVHPSLLPAWRGAAPIPWTILAGDPVTGVTVFRMDAGMDTGPILLQVEEPVLPDETAAELAARLAELGAEALTEALALLEAGRAIARPQDEARATYAPKLTRAQARIDWSRSAEEVARALRAFDDAPGAWSELDGVPVALFRPRLADDLPAAPPGTVLVADPRRGLAVAAGRGALWIGEVQPPGRRRMTAAEWVRGRGVRAGQRFAG